MKRSRVCSKRVLVAAIAAQLCGPMQLVLRANPMGGTVSQGTASFTTSGSQFTINTSDRAYINWSSFNIGVGQTTTFVEPSANSLVWNQINDSNPSQILGNLNANGYVVLQNQNGFYVGGQATITAHGLIMTTAAVPPPDLSGGGAWSFTAPPPTARIINYGRINLSDGGSAFLIADNIENDGSISAPSGNLGLYAGQTVLVSTRPDGRGLSARVTLPKGMVNNQGQLIADGGSIALQAQLINQGGLIQANTVQNVNGAIQLVASDSVNLAANSVISATGASQGDSSGGSVKIRSDNAYTDHRGSTISVAGGSQGGNGGQLEISGGSVNAILSKIDGHAARGFQGGEITIDPLNLDLTSSFVRSLTPVLSGGFYQINLQADNDIQFDTVWTLTDPGGPAILTLTAGNSIIFKNNSGIKAVLTDAGGNPVTQNNWSVNMIAGTELTSPANRQSGSDGIYLLGNSFIQTLNGNINSTAANEVIVNAASDFANGGNPINVTLLDGSTVDALNSGPVGSGANWNGIRTLRGGSIDVTATYGDVNTGGNYNGYTFGQNAAPYYRVNTSQLGGISTGNGGDVTITAGGNIASYLPLQNNYLQAKSDGGSGAFGANPGNVTIVAGGNVSGHYVVADGAGTITAGNGNIGAPTASGGFALSLIKGSWNVSAPNGSIYLQDVRNPNGLFNDANPASPGYHYFNYDPMDSLSLQAGNSVEITGAGAPHIPTFYVLGNTPIPFIFPSTLDVIAGSGGFVLDQDVTLFPSPNADLQITTQHGGNFEGNGSYLEMSDSAARQFDPEANVQTFSPQDHAATPLELNNPNPVTIAISGNMENVTLYTTKRTQVTVGGNAFNANLVGENLHAGDVTSFNVAGKISFSPVYVFANLTQGITSANPQISSSWDTLFSLLVDPAKTASFALNGNEDLATLDGDASQLRLFLANSTAPAFSYVGSANPGFLYDAATKQLAYQYQMTPFVLNALTGPLKIIQVNPGTGLPVLVHGQTSLGQDPTKFYFATTTVTFAPASVIQTLFAESQNSAPRGNAAPPGFEIGGPGQFDISAASMDLGSSEGILSWGFGAGAGAPRDYSDLAGITPFEQGASLNVTVAGDLNMLSSTIASVFGGNVTVNTGGKVELSQGQFNLPQPSGTPCYGIYTSGYSDVNVTAGGNIDVGSSRIASFNGGNVFVESLDGSVNAGFGANSALFVPDIYKDPVTGKLVTGQIGNSLHNPEPYGSGILAIAPTKEYSWSSHPVPGNITVRTPRGDIVSTLGGIDQFALDGNISAGPTITLTAGTPASHGSPAIPGNVDLGQGGVVGGTVNITAQGSISGLIVSHQNSTIVAAQNINATILSGGTANVNASGSIQGTVIGVGGVSATGGSITASLLGQNVTANGGAAQSTLGTTAAATSTSQAAAQESTTEAKQEVASNDTSQDDEKKKQAKNRPVLARRVGRVTVLLPKPN